MWASEAEIDSLLVKSGDLLVCEGGEVGRAMIVPETPQDRTIIQNALHLVRGRNGAEPRFLAYLLKHASDQGWFEVICNRSTIAHFTVEKFEEQWVYLPDKGQQREIADYLDRETTRLDELMAEKERLLDLLAEKRRALINNAVTRGLDPNVPLCNSSVPWLEKMPAHWSCRNLRYCCMNIHTGGTPAPEFLDHEGKDSGIDWFTPGDFDEGLLLCRSSRRVAAMALDIGKLWMFPPGAVLVVGIGATLGKVGLLRTHASANQQINALIPRNDVDSTFLAYELSVISKLLRVSANMATLPILNQQRMGEVSVLIPPLKEQKIIVEHIARETAKIDNIRVVIDNTITLLKERRSALIVAAVTGHIDIRNVA